MLSLVLLFLAVDCSAVHGPAGQVAPCPVPLVKAAQATTSVSSPSLSSREKRDDKQALKRDYEVRDGAARDIAAAVEHDGWQLEMRAWKSGCKAVVCGGRGNHDALRIWMTGGTVEAVDRFFSQEIQPRMIELRGLSFVEVDIVGLQHSNSYPSGGVVFQVK